MRERANFGDLPDQTLDEFVAMWQRCDRERGHVPEVGLSAHANGQQLESWLRAMHALLPEGRIVASSHGGTITDFLLNIFPQTDLERYRPDFMHNFGNCSITVVDFDGDRFTLDRLADVHHLV